MHSQCRRIPLLRGRACKRRHAQGSKFRPVHTSCTSSSCWDLAPRAQLQSGAHRCTPAQGPARPARRRVCRNGKRRLQVWCQGNWGAPGASLLIGKPYHSTRGPWHQTRGLHVRRISRYPARSPTCSCRSLSLALQR